LPLLASASFNAAPAHFVAGKNRGAAYYKAKRVLRRRFGALGHHGCVRMLGSRMKGS